MNKEKVGTVTESEKNEVMTLYQEKMALQELMMALDSQTISKKEKNYIYERIIKDFENAKIKYEKWWSDISQKYQWESKDNGHWTIDFSTCEVFLA